VRHGLALLAFVATTCTPYCVTIDFDTLGEEKPELKDTVTLRNRDTGAQERIALTDLLKKIK